VEEQLGLVKETHFLLIEEKIGRLVIIIVMDFVWRGLRNYFLALLLIAAFVLFADV
jgi:hypothetical protein